MVDALALENILDSFMLYPTPLLTFSSTTALNHNFPHLSTQLNIFSCNILFADSDQYHFDMSRFLWNVCVNHPVHIILTLSCEFLLFIYPFSPFYRAQDKMPLFIFRTITTHSHSLPKVLLLPSQLNARLCLLFVKFAHKLYERLFL